MKEIINKIKNRKKKKGFTLVELLAVIVILAIIMVITIPLVLNNIGEAKKKSFETVGKTLVKYIDDNYHNCKLGNKDIAKYDESLFDEGTCNLKEDIQNGTSKEWIYNAGYSDKEIGSVKVSINPEGRVDIIVKPSNTGEYKDVEDYTTIVLNYDPSCWETRNMGNLYINKFNGIDDDGNVKNECNGFAEKDSEGLYHLNIPSKIGDSIIYGIAPSAFLNDTLISYLTISNGIEVIMQQAFLKSSLKEVVIPASVKTINMSAFSGVSTLKKIDFEENSQLTSIGDGAFNSTGITSVKIPNSVQKIGNSAFANCSSLTELKFEENSQLQTINNSAFSSTGITSVKIPNRLQTIGESAFANCSSLTELKFEENSQLQTINNLAFNGDNINIVEIPESVVTIGSSAFAGTKIVHFVDEQSISTNLKTIGANAFSTIIQNEVIIPKSVETIGDLAFYSNKSIVINYCGSYNGTNWYNGSTTTIDRNNCGE